MSDSLLKKQFQKRDVERLRNLIKGKTGEKTTSGIGYNGEESISYKEGDIWEADGKTWTIRDGIKENVTKLDKFKNVAVPIFCPKCKQNMDGQLDPYYYKSYGECVNCRAVTETKLKHEGKWEEYIKSTFNKEIDINIEEYKNFMADMLSESNNSFITEAGDIQKWDGGINKKRANSALEEGIKYFESLKKK
tara:strand:- start:850 stop:1425 length:576 start_codon:yes stop_codon:yes gene_type:complete